MRLLVSLILISLASCSPSQNSKEDNFKKDINYKLLFDGKENGLVKVDSIEILSIQEYTEKGYLLNLIRMYQNAISKTTESQRYYETVQDTGSHLGQEILNYSKTQIKNNNESILLYKYKIKSLDSQIKNESIDDFEIKAYIVLFNFLGSDKYNKTVVKDSLIAEFDKNKKLINKDIPFYY